VKLSNCAFTVFYLLGIEVLDSYTYCTRLYCVAYTSGFRLLPYTELVLSRAVHRFRSSTPDAVRYINLTAAVRFISANSSER
jgi:hypothetical protein